MIAINSDVFYVFNSDLIEKIPENSSVSTSIKRAVFRTKAFYVRQFINKLRTNYCCYSFYQGTKRYKDETKMQRDSNDEFIDG